MLFSRIKRRAFSMRDRRSASVMGAIPSVIGLRLRMAGGTLRSSAAGAMAAAAVTRKSLRVTRKTHYPPRRGTVIFMFRLLSVAILLWTGSSPLDAAGCPVTRQGAPGASLGNLADFYYADPP